MALFRRSNRTLLLAGLFSGLTHLVVLVSPYLGLPQILPSSSHAPARLLASVVPPASRSAAVESAPRVEKAGASAPSGKKKSASRPVLASAESSRQSAQTAKSLDGTSSSAPAGGKDSAGGHSGQSGESADQSAPTGALSQTEQGEGIPLEVDNWVGNGCVKYAFLVRYGLLGGELGSAQHCWSRDAETYFASLKGRAAVAWRGYDIVQRSVGSIVNGAPVPAVFFEESDGKQYETQFGTGKIEQNRNGNKREVDTGQGAALDMLALTHYLSMLPEETQNFDAFVVVNRGNVSRVTIEQFAPAREEFPIGSSLARRFFVEANNGELKIEVWIGKQMHNMPLRFRIINKGDTFDFQAIEVSIDGKTLTKRPEPETWRGND